jgi:hypothetical protein
MWEARVEGRLNQLIISDNIASYTVYTTSFREVASVQTSAPSTTIAISAGVMLRL